MSHTVVLGDTTLFRSIIAYPDGRLAAVVSTEVGFDVVDITDPTDPELLRSVLPPELGHKLV